MQEIYNDKYLLNKYDPLQLMVCQSVLCEIEETINKIINKYIKNIEEVQYFHADVWVNKILYDVYRELKDYRRIKLFKHHVVFCPNTKMKDDQFKVYNIGIKIEDNYLLPETIDGENNNV